MHYALVYPAPRSPNAYGPALKAGPLSFCCLNGLGWPLFKSRLVPFGPIGASTGGPVLARFDPQWPVLIYQLSTLCELRHLLRGTDEVFRTYHGSGRVECRDHF